jgi:hypothetical protein
MTGGSRATLAIVRWQARAQLGPWVPAVAGVLFGLSVLPEYARAAGSLPYALALAAMVLMGVASSAIFGLRRSATIELTSLRYYGAPLYGRELARAHAIMPALRSLLFALGVGAGLGIAALLHRDLPPGVPALLVALALGQPVVALIALSGCLRSGSARALYGLLAVGAGCALESAALFGGPAVLAGTAVAAVVAGFFALRAFGETLARYDPVWT